MTALEHHQAGRLAQAETLYREVLRAEPDSPDALHLLGVIANQAGKNEAAVELIGKAIAINRRVAEFHNNLGNALRELGRLPEAVRSFEMALSLKSNYPDAHNNLGVALKDEGRCAEAQQCYERALALQPSFPAALTNMGILLQQQGRLAEAERCQARALALDPNYAEAHSNLGNALREQGRIDEAIRCYRRALALKPDSPDIYNNLGAALKLDGKLEEAIRCYHSALALKPDSATSHSNLGAALKEQGRLAEAIECYEKALALQPDFHNVRWNRALALLETGDLARGWAEYESGWDAGQRKPRRELPPPLWDGGTLAGKTILVWGEQGLGDEMVFAGMVPEVAAAAAHCVLECEPRLVTLFARSFPAVEVIARTEPPNPRLYQPDIGLRTPAASLARWLRPSLESFPKHDGYLRPAPDRVEHWRGRLAGLGAGLKVGICWRSKVVTAARSPHYTQLGQWGPILTLPGIHFVNLQYDECRQELEEAQQQFGGRIQDWDDIDLLNDLDEAAALTAGLDLILSPGTAVATMAGALGKPVWQLTLAHGGDWLTLGCDGVPWFPGMRVFWRAWNESWENVIARVARELRTPAGKSS